MTRHDRSSAGAWIQAMVWKRERTDEWSLRCGAIGRYAARCAALALLVGTVSNLRAQASPSAVTAPAASTPTGAEVGAVDPARETEWLTGTRQLTFEGRRSGEGYFSRDGKMMVFQSERDADNPFFQIYLLSLATGDLQRISPGVGKTTCAWIHPEAKQILFASTHDDPQAKQKQIDELAQRAAGTTRRYAWDYDEQYDLYRYDLATQTATAVAPARGYDAEGSWSPDGRLIAFASNRAAYAEPLPEVLRQRLEMDPSFFIDLYVMNSDGTQLRRLTNAEGYDGGPFFSPDGERICWRHFSADGATAEIMSMRVDGTDVKTLTHLGAMSWAPYYHPSGEYLIFTTNIHGFGNFELYLVDADGAHEPVRVTSTDGFDGLPVFTPDGKKLAWTTARAAGGASQIFIADWNHDHALELLGRQPRGDTVNPSTAAMAAVATSRATQADCSPRDIVRHIDYLCRPELKGRRTGTPGEQLATAYVAAYFDQLCLSPVGDDGKWFQVFQFTSGVSLGNDNQLSSSLGTHTVSRDWIPLGFSGTGSFDEAPVVYAGYGINAPAAEGQEAYDSFVHLDARGKWMLVYRFLPENITPERRQHLARHASLRFKAMQARDLGAHGLIVVSGPNSKVNEQLVPLQFDGSLSSSDLPIISVTDDVAQQWLQRGGQDLKRLQEEADRGTPTMGFEIPEVRVAAKIDIAQVERSGRNVLGRLQVGSQPSDQVVVVGAHIDHLGQGANTSSLARDNEREGIHFGADDNASGVAAMLEMAEWLAHARGNDGWTGERDLVFAAWSGEEEGLIGSSHFLKQLSEQVGGDDPHASIASLQPQIAACLNLDMVGRLDKKLVLQGVGSSTRWKSEVERRNAAIGLPITLQNDSYLPTDASAFFLRGVPILSAFTGTHEDYHTPRDTPDKINYEGAARIAQFMALVARAVSLDPQAPDFVEQAGPEPGQMRAQLRAFLGTIPDYTETDKKGVKLSGVGKNGPAATAGVQAGDVIVELAGRKIDNIYDYTFAIEALKAGEPTKIVVLRGEQRLTLDITPGSRQ